MARARVRRIVVLGTSTGVGKTHVGVALLQALGKSSGDPARPRALGLKPVETGYGLGRRKVDARSDAGKLGRASEPLSTLEPLYAFAPPVSPHLAARMEGTAIDPGRIRAWVDARANDVALHDMSSIVWCVIETAGGVFSPLAPGLTNFDLAMALEPAAWVLVAPDVLGVLHEVTATLDACAARGRRPDELVLSAARPRDSSTGTNAEELRALGIAEPIATLESGSTDLGELCRALSARRARS